MSAASHIWRILRKDMRAFRLEIGGLVVLNLLLVAVSAEPWATLVERYFERNSVTLLNDARLWIAGLIAAAWWIVVARVVQADLPASKTQFWLTRPYPRIGLLIEKLLFIFIFTHLLTIFSHAAIVSISGLPFTAGDLILNQLAFAVMLTLPAAGIASLTPTLGRFLIASFVVAAASGVLLLYSGLLGEDAYLNLSGLIDANPNRFNNWLRISLALMLMGPTTVAALIWQYRRRESMRVAGIWATVCLGVAVIVLAFPRSLSSRINSTLLGQPVSPPVLRLRGASGANTLALRRGAAHNYYELKALLTDTEPSWENIFDIPIDIQDREPGLVELANAVVDISTDAGERIVNAGGIWKHDDRYWVRFMLPGDFYSNIRNEPGSIRIDLDVLEYTAESGGSIPVDGSPVSIDSTERCGVAWKSVLVCRSAFSATGRWTTGPAPESEALSAILTKEIGRPAFNLNPVSLFRFEPAPFDSFYWKSLADHPFAAPVPVIIRVPSAYSRQSLEIDAARLSEWSLGENPPVEPEPEN